ncbi:hypothetical protein GCM10009077_38990 [Roseibium denhamense]
MLSTSFRTSSIRQANTVRTTDRSVAAILRTRLGTLTPFEAVRVLGANVAALALFRTLCRTPSIGQTNPVQATDRPVAAIFCARFRTFSALKTISVLRADVAAFAAFGARCGALSAVEAEAALTAMQTVPTINTFVADASTPAEALFARITD